MLRIVESNIGPSEVVVLQRIKNWIARTIKLRDQIIDESARKEPSEVWEFVTQVFRYLHSFPPEQFGNLRLHTYHIDGSTYWKVLLSKEKDYILHFSYLYEDLPDRYKLTAPEACGEYGWELQGGYFVNDKILVWQELIKALLSSGKLTELEEVISPIILEIGGGYGSLTHHLYSLIPQARFVIVDLPETLLFSASYLSLIHGDERVLLVENEQAISLEDIGNYTFILVPNFLLPSLADLKFDLSINVESFQEMTSDQVSEYLEFLHPRTKALLSWNYERSYFNMELESVSRLLDKYFELTELPYHNLESLFKKIRRKIIGRSTATVRVYNSIVSIVRRMRGGEGSNSYGWQPLKRYWAIPKTKD